MFAISVLSIVIFCTANILGTLSQSVDAANSVNKPKVVDSVDNKADFASSITKFSIDLFTGCVENATENVIISPYSVGTALALAANGAKGASFNQIKEALHLTGDKFTIADQFAASANELEANAGNATLKIANKLYVADGATIKKKFNEIAVNKFHSEAETTNFADSVGSAKKINDWIEEHTEHKIKDLIPAGALDINTRLVIVNAIYFKGTWKHQFEKAYSQLGEFHLNKADSKEVTLMTTEADFNYGELPELNARVIELPYANSDINFLIILPDDVSGLATVVSHLKNHSWHSFSQNLSLENVVVTIPKFKIEYSVTLNGHLEALGIRDIFDSNADLSELLESPEALFVSQVFHKAFISVDEEGAEAAAATALTIDVRIGDESPLPKYFYVDHPFLYAIRKGADILFIGSYISP